MTANISHELRTPLARMRISEEMLRQKLVRDGQGLLTRHLDDILQEIAALDVLVGRNLELSKLDMQAPRWYDPQPPAPGWDWPS